jgi:hypothetical protein
MENVFDQTRNMIQKTWEPWRELMTNARWGREATTGFQNWKPVLEAARADCEIGMTAWNSMMDNNGELFFTLFRQAPLYSEAVEDRLRGVWEGVRSMRKTQQDILLDNFKQAESLLKEQSAPGEKAAEA